MTTEDTGLSRYIQRQAQRVRAFDARRPWVWDVLLSVFWTGAALTDAAGGWRNIARDPSVPVWLVLAMSLALSVPLLWRRRHPMAVLAVMACASLASNVSGAFLQAGFLQLIVVFHIALRLPPRALARSLALIVPPLVTGAIRFPKGSWDQQVVPTLWAYAMVALLGIAVRSRQDYTAGLVDRARRLEIERDQQAQLAAAAERTRIAREMHDIIGHNLSVITGLADGGRYAAAKSPERAAQALDAIGTTSRQALTELRRLLGVLRDDSPEAVRDPQPSLADLDELITGVRTAGLPVRVEIRDAPEDGSLPAGAQLTVYRVVQEALTNTLKHAGPKARSTVLLAYGEDGLTVDVTDSGGGDTDATGTGRTGAGETGTGTGQGIAGMRERAALYDGTLEAGPLPTAGWRVRLRLPLTSLKSLEPLNP
ncbi:sensor histidine kinase [Streptomyces sp. ISL-36]|uniref:sensor histidine kinase n=1 Tax=Streptomyces sp. ISL-36 TaxID=2819182 RepID=UPI001BEAFB15|nr:histidine kinase [Streptomyces sp. ISL-36]MBT2444228.1 sensor histidine kinase [Streptomyces sp. ISL-36]